MRWILIVEEKTIWALSSWVNKSIIYILKIKAKLFSFSPHHLMKKILAIWLLSLLVLIWTIDIFNSIFSWETSYSKSRWWGQINTYNNNEFWYFWWVGIKIFLVIALIIFIKKIIIDLKIENSKKKNEELQKTLKKYGGKYKIKSVRNWR